MQLQFYSTAWEFGEGDTADLEVQIDSRAPWNLTGADLSRANFVNAQLKSAILTGVILDGTRGLNGFV